MSSIFKRLFDALRHYLRLERRFVMLTIAEKATVLLSMLIIVIVLIILAVMVIAFALLCMAHWLGELMQNLALGYLCSAGVAVLLTLIFYALREKIVINPLAAFMRDLIDDTTNSNKP